MDRRAFLLMTGATGALRMSRANAQARTPLIAVLNNGTEAATRTNVEAFRDGMRELGYREGVNYSMQVGWSDPCALRPSTRTRRFRRSAV